MNSLQPFSFNGKSFPVELRRHKRAKRITLRVCPKDKLIRVTLPQRIGVHKAEDFIQSHQEWIEKKLSLFSNEGSSDSLNLLGEKYTLKTDPLRRRAHISHSDRSIYIPPENAPKALKTAIIAYSKVCLAEMCADVADELGHSISAFSFRDPKTRWGSCSSQGKIMLSWRLILAPLEVARYVCIHEVCHLKHMNHSNNFWNLVASFDPNYKANRKWLRTHGSQLYRLPSEELDS